VSKPEGSSDTFCYNESCEKKMDNKWMELIFC